LQTKSKKDSEKTTRNIIKMSVKIGMLQRGEKFTKEEKDNLMKIQKTLRTVAMTLISFYQVDHTFDRTFVIKYLTELEGLLKGLIAPHLTEKSVGRVEQVGPGRVLNPCRYSGWSRRPSSSTPSTCRGGSPRCGV
jgi:hypothetical protein